jgi:type VI secretion system protein ImpL
MWLWILSALIVIVAWAAWFFYGLTFGVSYLAPLAVTAVVLLGVIGVIVFRRVRAARAARALEKAIAQQAQEQALAAKPERVAEIQEIHRQFQQGVAALKASKLGGGKRGQDALYVLPWYVMVGPPGAGKTTALRHSGLVFPYLDPSGSGVKGVGGTRNCDWWFTNEAILLDTAGRYTTEADDHDEWMAFLEQLLKYRVEKPLNGVIVAVSVSEMLDATDDQIQQTAKKIRARIDEMQDTLKETLPVYVLFTKIDLVAGFSEFFGDMKKSERSQPWGATFRLDADKRDPGKLFDGEFDILVERLHTKGLKRMALERTREVKEKVYQFPLEFAAIKRNMSDFLAAAFAPAGTGPQPIMRGFYFTSGLQEGKPLDRVVGAMGRAFGLRGGPEEAPAEAIESKSFFLRDVFMNVVFPDATLATRSEAEIARLRRRQLYFSVAAGIFALAFLVPSVIRFYYNRGFIAETESIAQAAKSVDWADARTPALDKVSKLDDLRRRVALLYVDSIQTLDVTPEGDTAPDQNKRREWKYGWPMYKGDTLRPPTKDEYIAILHKGFMEPTKAALEEKLRRADGSRYLEDYNTLKAYLLLDDKIHIQDNDDWETGRLTQIWADFLRRSNSEVPEADLKAKLRDHVQVYVKLMKRGEAAGEKLDDQLIGNVRDRLLRIGSTGRYYDKFVTVLIDQRYDESGPPDPANLKYPPINLANIFPDRQEVLGKVRSWQKEHQGSYVEVQGPYTYKGHEAVLASLAEGRKELEREKWVLPLTGEEERAGDAIDKNLQRVREEYDQRYISQWENFFRDIEVEIPPTNKEAISEFKILSTPDWPYQRLLRALADNTQFDEVAEKSEAESQLLGDGGVIDQIRLRTTRRIEQKGRGIRIDRVLAAGQKPEYVDPIPEKFRSMVRFAVPPPQPKPKDGEPPRDPAPVEIGTYVGKLADLAGEMGNIEDGPRGVDTKKATEKFEDAVKTTQSELLKIDDYGQRLMEPLLMNPLKQAYKAVMRSAGGSASGLWQVVVAPPYESNIKDRYPFNLAATRDASLSDAIAFYKPKGGILWGFYDQYLKQFHRKEGHDYIPETHLDDSRAAHAKPFTPFRALLYPCLKRSDEITEALFEEGSEKPKVEFQINLKTVSPIVSEVILEVDGQKRLYRNEKEFWNPMTWPGQKPTGARIQVRGAGGLDEEIVREGPWGIFRLFEAGTTTAEKDKDDVFTVTWQMTAPPVTVTLQVRPVRANHPFSPSFFRATNCPHDIGDSFGKGSKGKG